jgi:hypothetical protein
VAFVSASAGSCTVDGATVQLTGEGGVFKGKTAAGAAGDVMLCTVPVWAVLECSRSNDEQLLYGGFLRGCMGLAAPAGGSLGTCGGDGSLAHDARCLLSCEDGKVKPVDCWDGTMSTAADCCSSGMGWNGEHGVACEECPAGQADLDASPGTPCTDCPAGAFSGTTGAMECSACPAGMYSVPGSISGSDCEECRAGQADLDASPGTPCTDCPPSYFSNVTGALECLACPAGLVAWHMGTPECYISAWLDDDGQALPDLATSGENIRIYRKRTSFSSAIDVMQSFSLLHLPARLPAAPHSAPSSALLQSLHTRLSSGVCQQYVRHMRPVRATIQEEPSQVANLIGC